MGDREGGAVSTRKLMVAGAVAGAMGLGTVVGAVVFAPDASLAEALPIERETVCIGGSWVIGAAAEAMGIEPAELTRALREGWTIADVAEENEVDVQDVVDAIVASERERLEDAIDAGRLTKRQADAIADDLDERVTDLVNGDLAPFPLPVLPHLGLWPAPIAFVADLIGIEPDELLAALADGRTIAEVARGKGVEVDAVVDAIVSELRDRLDDAVENGWLTREEADERATALEERVRDLVNRELGFPGPGWIRGPLPPRIHPPIGWDDGWIRGEEFAPL
jgi:uncharacterized protein (DUF433 family)